MRRLPGVLVTLLALAAPPLTAQGRANPHRELHGLACTACHGTGGWHGVSFDHRRTGYTLRGQHVSAPCAGCHDLRDFRTAARTCGTCHQDPHRGDAGAACDQCHVETAWRVVNPQDAHARSRLPDLGVHAAMRCEDCHPQTGVQPFHSRVTPCVGCHQATYNATANPPHAANGIPTSCDQCHQMATWQFALFPQHDAVFPIYTGSHAGVWNSCASCHPSATDFSQFTCLTCHTQPPTDRAHQGIPGYAYDSPTCLGCHPRGSGGDLSFHETTFPIFAAPHGGTWSACSDCHIDPANRRTVTCMGGACHPQTTTDGAHQGIPGYGYTAPQCLTCHPDGRAGTFTQHDVLFPIYSGSHAGRWASCATCHTDPTSRQVYTCMGGSCHPRAEMDSHHTQVANYSYVATECYRCHPTGRNN